MTTETSMTRQAPTIRKDGKPARKPRLGVPAGSPRPNPGHGTPPAPEWHALVVAGPKGDPRKALTRAEQVRHGITLPPSSVLHGRQQHGVPVRPWSMGALILHRMTARSGGGIDRSVKTPAAVENRRQRDARKAAS